VTQRRPQRGLELGRVLTRHALTPKASATRAWSVRSKSTEK
jgi:hypothetical protein